MSDEFKDRDTRAQTSTDIEVSPWSPPAGVLLCSKRKAWHSLGELVPMRVCTCISAPNAVAPARDVRKLVDKGDPPHHGRCLLPIPARTTSRAAWRWRQHAVNADEARPRTRDSLCQRLYVGQESSSPATQYSLHYEGSASARNHLPMKLTSGKCDRRDGGANSVTQNVQGGWCDPRGAQIPVKQIVPGYFTPGALAVARETF